MWHYYYTSPVPVLLRWCGLSAFYFIIQLATVLVETTDESCVILKKILDEKNEHL